MINYSIIIPHKNSADLLSRCLDSIPSRSDLQIIIVDDNSDPNRVDFNAFPGLERSYTEVYFSKEGRGAGYARNVGLSYAKGKWLLFADADDFFNDFFLNSTDVYLNSDYDIIYFSASSVDSDTGAVAKRHLLLERSLSGYNKNIPETRDFITYRSWEPWSKMIRSEFVREFGLRFEEVKVANDFLFIVQAGECARRIQIDKTAIYCVTYNRNSITYSKIQKEESFDEMFNSKIRMNNYLHSRGKKQFKIPLTKDILLGLRLFGLRKFLITVKTAESNNNRVFLGFLKSAWRSLLRLSGLHI